MQRSPRAIAAGVSAFGDEFNAVFTPDMGTVFFSRANRNYSESQIYSSSRTAEGWSDPLRLPFSSDFVEFDPFITPDGRKLLFVSARPVDGVRKGYEIWTAEKTADGWGEPRNLGPVVNTSQNDAFVTAAANGNLYFCSDRDGSLGSYDIYVSRLVDGQYQRPENLGPRINTAQMDTDPLISPDERFLIFSRGDFYISYNAGGEWTEPELLGGGINTPEAHEFTPGFSPDGKWFYFTRQSQAGRKVYQVDVRALGLKREARASASR